MTKINSYIKMELTEAIKSMGSLLINAEPCTVPADEILDLALSAESKFVLAKAAELVNASPKHATYIRCDLDEVLPPGVSMATNDSQSLFLQFDEPKAIMLPTTLNPPSNAALLNLPSLRAWLQWRLRIGTVFGALIAIVDQAYIRDMTLEQLRYVLPAVVMLTKRREGLNKYTDRLQEFKAPSVLPKLTPGWRAILAEVSELMGIAALLDPTAPVPKTSVTLGGDIPLNHPTMGRIRLV